MNLRRGVRLAAGILLLLPLAGRAQEAPPTEAPSALPAGAATLVVGEELLTVPTSLPAAGPLFALAPIVAKLGGRLDTGPLGESFTLTLGDTSAVVGPGSPALTIGRDIIALSQPTGAGEGGLHVPLDFLQRTYGDVQGFEFEWRAAELKLIVTHRVRRELPVAVDLVTLQGVTTVVLQFGEAPHYRLQEKPGSIDVLIDGDTLKPAPMRPPAEGALVRRVEFTPERVHLELLPGTSAHSYVLRGPFRLVFDVNREAATPAPLANPTPPVKVPGLQTIVIDPGHGGPETGAIGPGGAQEKDLTLLLAQAVKSRLETRLPVRVVLTRTEDGELPLDTRAALANQFKADLFVSIHLNSSVGPGAHGAETYFLATRASDEHAASAAAAENATGSGRAAGASAGEEGDPLYDLQLMLWDLAQSHHLAESQRLANFIQEELNTTLGLRDRGVKQAPFRVLMGAAMPAVLVELGFISNPEEEKKLLLPAYRADLADALVRAVVRFATPAAVPTTPPPAAAPAPAPPGSGGGR